MFQYTIGSDTGRVREVNEDRAAVLQRENGIMLGMVADGMGGHNAGDVASKMTVEGLGQLFLNEPEETFQTAAGKKDWLSESVRHINRQIYEHAASDPQCSGMGTTLIAALLGNGDCIICHIGDSRAYLIGDAAEQVTRDHSYVNLLVDNGQLSQEEAEDHPKKNLIVRAIGTEPDIDSELLSISLGSSSYLLICSDGLSNKLSKKEMAAILHAPVSLSEKGKELIRRANELGGEDNISFVLFSRKSGVS